MSGNFLPPHPAPDGSGTTTTLSDDEYFKLLGTPRGTSLPPAPNPDFIDVNTPGSAPGNPTTGDLGGAGQTAYGATSSGQGGGGTSSGSDDVHDEGPAQGGGAGSGTQPSVQLKVGGQVITGGWERIGVMLSCERLPASFMFELADSPQGNSAGIVATAGQPCTVVVNGVTIITGRIDRVQVRIGHDHHSLVVRGRSLSRDLVDCSSDIPGSQILATNASDAITRICKPFGINVKVLSTDTSQPIIQQGIELAATPYEVIEGIARFAAFLVYDDPDGSVILAQAGAESMASGVTYGQNVQAADVTFSIDQRFSVYVPVTMATDMFSDQSAGNQIPGPPITGQGVVDTGDYRPMVVVSEQANSNGSLARQRATWEAARRLGRSQALRVTVDTWTDSSGALWTPNKKCPVNVPPAGLSNLTWIISEVELLQDLEVGTVANLVLMPPEAFTPAPPVRLYDYQTQQALAAGQAGGLTGAQPTPTPQ